MSLSRYSFSSNRKNSLGQKIVGISSASPKIFNAIENQLISYSVHVMEEGERLDYLSGLFYKDSKYWWVLAAASGIGYGLQVPPGTLIRVPNSLGEVFGVLV